MKTEAATATKDLISACRDHEQYVASASLGQVLAAAKIARAQLTASWRECAEQLVVAEELRSIDESLGRMIHLLEEMEREPERSFRGELAAECARLHSINDALRELLDHSSALPPLAPVLVNIVAAAAALRALRGIACRREDFRQRWAELTVLRVVDQVHLEKIAELCLAELRALSDARFFLKRWRAAAGEQPRFAYVFENRLHAAPQAALDAGVDPFVATRDAMAAHRERVFASSPGVAIIHQILECFSGAASGRRAAA
jgi:hypothetical protein